MLYGYQGFCYEDHARYELFHYRGLKLYYTIGIAFYEELFIRHRHQRRQPFPFFS